MSTVGNKKISQQLVEFLLVVPFMVIILGILTEYAYALNINLTIGQAIKTATSAGYMAKDEAGVDRNYGTYSQIGPQASATDSSQFIIDKVTAGFIQYLKDNNVPTTIENEISVRPLTIGQTTIFVASYTYIPAFTLPNVFFKILPDRFNFSAAAAVPSAFLASNSGYVGGYDTTDLNRIWASSGDLADITSFDNAKRGILKSDDNSNPSFGRDSVLFVMPYPSISNLIPSPYLIFNWNGSDLTPYFALSMSDGRFWDCGEAGCFPTSQSLRNFIYNRYYQVMFVNRATYPFSTNWNNILEDTMSLKNGGSSVGNYENINVSPYIITNFGSTKIVSTSADNANIIGTIISSSNYLDFGSPVYP